MVRKYNNRRKLHHYTEGDQVKISNDEGERIYKYLGKITKVNGNYTYKVEWVSQGPKEDDVIGSVATRSIKYKLIKPYKKTVGDQNISETTGTLFNTPTKDNTTTTISHSEINDKPTDIEKDDVYEENPLVDYVPLPYTISDSEISESDVEEQPLKRKRKITKKTKVPFASKRRSSLSEQYRSIGGDEVVMEKRKTKKKKIRDD